MREGSIRMFEVQANFEATDDRCLKLQKGDVVYGFYEFQGWMFGFKKDQESEYGFFPPTYVKLLEFWGLISTLINIWIINIKHHNGSLRYTAGHSAASVRKIPSEFR